MEFRKELWDKLDEWEGLEVGSSWENLQKVLKEVVEND